jgi:hypothetical protein
MNLQMHWTCIDCIFYHKKHSAYILPSYLLVYPRQCRAPFSSFLEFYNSSTAHRPNYNQQYLLVITMLIHFYS